MSGEKHMDPELGRDNADSLPEQSMGAVLGKVREILGGAGAESVGLAKGGADEALSGISNLRAAFEDEGLKRNALKMMLFINSVISSAVDSAGDADLSRAAGLSKKYMDMIGEAIFGKEALKSVSPEELQKYLAEKNLKFDPDSAEGKRFTEKMKSELREIMEKK